MKITEGNVAQTLVKIALFCHVLKGTNSPDSVCLTPGASFHLPCSGPYFSPSRPSYSGLKKKIILLDQMVIPAKWAGSHLLQASCP